MILFEHNSVWFVLHEVNESISHQNFNSPVTTMCHVNFTIIATIERVHNLKLFLVFEYFATETWTNRTRMPIYDAINWPNVFNWKIFRVYRHHAHSWVFTPRKIKQSKTKRLHCQPCLRHQSGQMSSMRFINWCAVIIVKLMLWATKLVSGRVKMWRKKTCERLLDLLTWILICAISFECLNFRSPNISWIMGNRSCCCSYSVSVHQWHCGPQITTFILYLKIWPFLIWFVCIFFA